MKDIIVTFPNGDKFSISAKEVALNRTNYYCSQGHFGHKSNEWHESFEYSMKNGVLTNWLANNMDWSDVEHCAIRIENKPNYHKLFGEAYFSVEPSK